MLTNKDIVSAYKRPKLIKRVYYERRGNTWYTYSVIFLFGFAVISVSPTIAVGLYLKQSALQLAIRSGLALISYWGTTLFAATPFMGPATCSNPVECTRNTVAVYGACAAGFIPQLAYALYMLC